MADDLPPFAAELEVDGPPTPIVLDPGQRWVVEVTMATAQPLDEESLIDLDEQADQRHDATAAARAGGPGFVLTTEVGGAQIGDVVAFAGQMIPASWLVDLHVRTPGQYEADALRGDPGVDLHVTARATRDDDQFWLVHVPEINSYTQARSTDEIEPMARDLVAAMLEIEPGEVSVRLEMSGEPQGLLGEPEVLVPVPADELERDYAAGIVPRPLELTDAERQRIADDVAAAKRDELVARCRADGYPELDAQQAAAISLGEPADCEEATAEELDRWKD